MGTAAETLGRVSKRLNTTRIIIIAALTLIITILIFGAYGSSPKVRGATQSFWVSIPRPFQQSPEKSNAHPAPEYSIVDEVKVSPPAPPPDTEEYIAMCLLVKEDTTELREFFTHHYYHHGIRRFYIYDDGSQPPLSSHSIQQTYNVPDSVLNFTYISPDSVQPSERKALQDRTMERCVQEHGSKHHWFGLLDPDEFIEMRHPLHPTLLGWLRHWGNKDGVVVDGKYAKSMKEGSRTDEKIGEKLQIGAMSISWLPHNSAGFNSTPSSGGFRANFNECVAGGLVANESRGDFFTVTHNKYFVRPGAIDHLFNIHAPLLNEGYAAFSEQGGFDFSVSMEPPSHEYWALHHYATGSRQYFEQKQRRGRSQGKGVWPVDEDYWRRYHSEVTTYRCDEMVGYSP